MYFRAQRATLQLTPSLSRNCSKLKGRLPSRFPGQPSSYQTRSHSGTFTQPAPIPFLTTAASLPSNATPEFAAALAAIASEPEHPSTIYSLPPRNHTSETTNEPSKNIGSSAEYLSLRENDISNVYKLSPSTWNSLLHKVGKGQMSDIRARVLEDGIFTAVHRPEEFSEVILQFFGAPIRKHLLPTQVLELFHAFSTHGDISQHTSIDSLTLIYEAISTEPHFDIYIPFIRTTFRKLITPNTGPANVPPQVDDGRRIWLLFRLMERLLRLDPPHERLAVEIFSNLSMAKWIPTVILRRASKAMSAPGNAGQHMLPVLLLEACITTCFTWGWHARGIELLGSTLPVQELHEDFKNAPRLELRPSLDQHPRSSLESGGVVAKTFGNRIPDNHRRRMVESLAMSLLQFPSTSDLDSATTLLLRYHNVLSIPGEPLAPEVVHEYFRKVGYVLPTESVYSVYCKYRSQIDTEKVLHQLVLTAAADPHVSKPHLGEMLAEILEHDLQRRQGGGGQTTSEIPIQAVKQAARNDLIGHVQEIWLRALDRWEGYHRVGLCGDGDLTKELVRGCIRLHQRGEDIENRWRSNIDGPEASIPQSSQSLGAGGLRNPLNFARAVLDEYGRIQLKLPRDPDPQKELYEECEQELRNVLTGSST